MTTETRRRVVYLSIYDDGGYSQPMSGTSVPPISPKFLIDQPAWRLLRLDHLHPTRRHRDDLGRAKSNIFPIVKPIVTIQKIRPKKISRSETMIQFMQKHNGFIERIDSGLPFSFEELFDLSISSYILSKVSPTYHDPHLFPALGVIHPA